MTVKPGIRIAPRWLGAGFFLLLTACANMPGKPGADLFDLQRQAAEAYQQQHYKSALAFYQRLAQQVPGDALIWFRLGNVQARLSMPDEAVASYRHALLLNPRLSKAWHNMGVIQLRQAAATYTEMATQVDPIDPLHGLALHNAEQLLQMLGEQQDQPHAEPAEH